MDIEMARQLLLGRTIVDVLGWTENAGTSTEREGMRLVLDDGTLVDMPLEDVLEVVGGE